MNDVDSFNLFKAMLKEGYTVEQAVKIVGLSKEETEFYLGLLGYDASKIDEFPKVEEQKKAAI